MTFNDKFFSNSSSLRGKDQAGADTTHALP